jgi:hypothetical protein
MRANADFVVPRPRHDPLLDHLVVRHGSRDDKRLPGIVRCAVAKFAGQLRPRMSEGDAPYKRLNVRLK